MTDKAVSFAETRINQGGLMRCCIATIQEYVNDHYDEAVSDLIIDCKYMDPNNQEIRLIGTVWQWNRPAWLDIVGKK